MKAGVAAAIKNRFHSDQVIRCFSTVVLLLYIYTQQTSPHVVYILFGWPESWLWLSAWAVNFVVVGIAALRYTVFVDILTVVFLVREFFGLKNVRMSIYLINGCLVWSGFFQLLCLPLSVPSLCTLVYINSTSIIYLRFPGCCWCVVKKYCWPKETGMLILTTFQVVYIANWQDSRRLLWSTFSHHE